jgi:hypothetical protein
MALPILDGNQSATTLSTIIDGGAHIPAHTVVSLGSQAISDITSAVSGSVVSVSNFPSTQTIAGTVTANLNNIGGGHFDLYSLLINEQIPVSASLASGIEQIGSVTVGNSVTIGSLPAISGTVTANVLGYDQPNDGFTQIRVQAANENISPTTPVLAVGIANEGGGITANNPLPVSGTVTLSEFVSVESSQERLIGTTGGNTLNAGVGISFNLGGASSIVGTSNPFPISGTVTANVNFASANDSEPAAGVKIGYQNTGGDYVPVREDGNGFPVNIISVANSVPISGTVTANPTGTQTIAGTVTASNIQNIFGSTEIYVTDYNTDIKFSSANPFPISNPNGALTTRFGSVTTANTAELTSAVTNTSRKYLLVQNIASATVTIGIGFAPTTTQGIQLSAGGGLTFDAFCPTGAVYWLSSVTGSNWSILEG